MQTIGRVASWRPGRVGMFFGQRLWCINIEGWTLSSIGEFWSTIRRHLPTDIDKYAKIENYKFENWTLINYNCIMVFKVPVVQIVIVLYLHQLSLMNAQHHRSITKKGDYRVILERKHIVLNLKMLGQVEVYQFLELAFPLARIPGIKMMLFLLEEVIDNLFHFIMIFSSKVVNAKRIIIVLVLVLVIPLSFWRGPKHFTISIFKYMWRAYGGTSKRFLPVSSANLSIRSLHRLVFIEQFLVSFLYWKITLSSIV